MGITLQDGVTKTLLKNVALGLTEQLDENKVERLIQSLFPKGKEEEEEPATVNQDDDVDDGEEMAREKKILDVKVLETVRRSGAGNPALGLDRITTSILKSVPEAAHKLIVKAFSACLKESCFPTEWKRASLVLLPKAGNIMDGLPRARPICLLSEVGKTLERLIADRIKR